MARIIFARLPRGMSRASSDSSAGGFQMSFWLRNQGYCGWLRNPAPQKDGWNLINDGKYWDLCHLSTGDLDFATIHSMMGMWNLYTKNQRNGRNIYVLWPACVSTPESGGPRSPRSPRSHLVDFRKHLVNHMSHENPIPQKSNHVMKCYLVDRSLSLLSPRYFHNSYPLVN